MNRPEVDESETGNKFNIIQGYLVYLLHYNKQLFHFRLRSLSNGEKQKCLQCEKGNNSNNYKQNNIINI